MDKQPQPDVPPIAPASNPYGHLVVDSKAAEQCRREFEEAQKAKPRWAGKPKRKREKR